MVRSHLRRARARLRRGEGVRVWGPGRAPRSPHPPVVPDALEEVQSLLQAVGLVVLPNDHVVAAAGHHEDDGGHICGAGRAKAARERRRRPPPRAEKRGARGERPVPLPLKHWIHLRRSSRWPPTSNMLRGRERGRGHPPLSPPAPRAPRLGKRGPATYWKLTLSTWNLVSKIPEVRTRQRSRS